MTGKYNLSIHGFFGAVIAAVLMSGPVLAQTVREKPSGRVVIDQVQVAFVVSGNAGGGRLMFNGRTYKFNIGGLGIGGIGASTLHATGTVYRLKNVRDFEGAYAQASYGAAVGNVGTGELMLQNDKGVYMRLRAQKKGIALSLGGDAVIVDLK